jgi:hypothetical protein
MDSNGNKTLYGKSLGSNQATFVADFSTIASGFKPPAILIQNGLKLQQNPLWEVSRIKPGYVCCGLFNYSLGGLSPRPFLYRTDLNGNQTLYGKSLGSNQAAFVVDFLMIVSGVQAPGHSYTEWTLVYQLQQIMLIQQLKFQ